MLFTESDHAQFFKEFDRVVSLEDVTKCNLLIKVLQKEGKTKLLTIYRGQEDETILHIAAKFNQSSDIIEILIQTCPLLMVLARKDSNDYFGQTALHVAIAKGNLDAVQIMLAEVYNQSQSLRIALLHQMASGCKFVNTVMMGELPLSVAALSFNHYMVEVLLTNGVEMERQNTKGDTVFHSLIRYAAIYPEQLCNVTTMINFLHEKIKQRPHEIALDTDGSDYCYIWFISNHEDLNPLQLAASLSQDAIFDVIFRLPKVYSYLNHHDGLFDRKSYDITEIDTITTELWATDQKHRRSQLRQHIAPSLAEGVSRHKFSNKSSTSCSPIMCLKREKRKSILEMMFDIKYSAAFNFIQQPVVRQVIKTKWQMYRIYYFLWMIFHVLFMTTLTFYAVYKAEDYKQPVNTTTLSANMASGGETRSNFLEAFSYIYLIVGILHFLHEVFHLLFRVKSYELVQLCNILHNGLYRIVLALFGSSLILEFGLSYWQNYENYMLIVALITGWWFCVFFLRAFKKFSFFTVMIQKIIFGDMFRFSLIIVLMLIAFSAAMFMAFKGARTENDELFSYFATMMLLFKLMLGLGDIEQLYEARRPWLAVTLFIVFVVLTYVLMLNALIAMMSQTCTIVSENRHVQWRVQQLSLIMFFEGVLPRGMTKMVGVEKKIRRYNPAIKQIIEEKRYFLDMSSLQTEYANAEDILSIKRLGHTAAFEEYQGTNFNPYLNVTNPTQNFMMSPRYNMHNPYSQYSELRLPNFALRSPNPDTPAMAYPSTPNNGSPTVNNEDREGREQREPDYQPSPNIKRRKSKRERKQSDNHDQSDNNANNQESSPVGRKTKNRIAKTRAEPEGDNTSYDDQNQFYLNHEHLTVPGHANVPVTPSPPMAERRRYNSEGGLIDTHIGNPLTQRYPIYRVQPQNGNSQQNGIEIGVIADSYM